MPLIPCPECGREISRKAEACPHCGCPLRPSTPARTGPKCYAGSATATTKCVSCGKLSCVEHLKSIYVRHGDGGAYELRCESCYSNAEAWKVFGWIVGGIILLVILLIFFASAGHH